MKGITIRFDIKTPKIIFSALKNVIYLMLKNRIECYSCYDYT